MCYSCLKPKTVCRGRQFSFVGSVPEVLKCAICASWAESKGLALFSIFFFKLKQHGDSKAKLTDLRKELEKYIGKLGSTVVDSKIQFSVNFLFKRKRQVKRVRTVCSPPAPTFDSETGTRLSNEKLKIYSESPEHS